MPEYLAPGVYVEEVSFRSKSVEGVSTTTTGFIGPCAYGPIDLEPDVITSLEMFEYIYGQGQRLIFRNNEGVDIEMDNYLWHAVRGFFSEGGTRLYIARVFLARADGSDGHAQFIFPEESPAAVPAGSKPFTIRARFPGAAGNMRVRFTLRLGQNVLSRSVVSETSPVEYITRVGALAENDVVWIGDTTSPFSSPGGSPPDAGAFYIASREYVPARKDYTWNFTNGAGTLSLDNLDPAAHDTIKVVSVIVTVSAPGGSTLVYEGALDGDHRAGGALDALNVRFAEDPPNIDQARTIPIIVDYGDNLENGIDVLNALLANEADLLGQVLDPDSTDDERSTEIVLEGGNDGQRPSPTEYEGDVDPVTNRKSGYKVFEDIEDISIVAAPGSTYGYDDPSYTDFAMTNINLLLGHARRMQYRIAVVDCGDDQPVSAVRALRAKISSKYGALYYPWVRILDPITRRQIHVPPSGFVAGIYARNDITRGVYKAPANEVVTLSIGFERLLNKGQQDVLNPEGINCFRFFEGRGYLLWGARMVTDDPEWKYVNLRRYFAYLERSIDRGTQWAVFEPNGPDLWANVRRTIESFLLSEWSNGALLGDTPANAFFVRCDRSIMTQNDLDNGRLVCLIGVAPIRPAEFVIFRIGQWTGDARR